MHYFVLLCAGLHILKYFIDQNQQMCSFYKKKKCKLKFMLTNEAIYRIID